MGPSAVRLLVAATGPAVGAGATAGVAPLFTPEGTMIHWTTGGGGGAASIVRQGSSDVIAGGGGGGGSAVYNSLAAAAVVGLAAAAPAVGRNPLVPVRAAVAGAARRTCPREPRMWCISRECAPATVRSSSAGDFGSKWRGALPEGASP